MRTRLQLFSMKYRTFHIGLLTYCDEEPKRLPKFRGFVRISATTCRKIRGAESLEEIRYEFSYKRMRLGSTCIQTGFRQDSDRIQTVFRMCGLFAHHPVFASMTRTK